MVSAAEQAPFIHEDPEVHGPHFRVTDPRAFAAAVVAALEYDPGHGSIIEDAFDDAFEQAVEAGAAGCTFGELCSNRVRTIADDIGATAMRLNRVLGG